WWCQNRGWPAHHHSRATFALRRVPGGTRLTLTHSGVPAPAYADIKQGWWENYWTPMKAMLEAGAKAGGSRTRPGRRRR
ncbi:MAG: SRPBCC domain-containing protein, partial [bacterium]